MYFNLILLKANI